MIRITLIGDILCEPMLLKAAKRNNNTFDFDCLFKNVKDMFAVSDYVIGNLETPIAGQDATYVKGLFSFNAPVDIVNAIKKAGIGLVSTANNHCLDRGFEGLMRTIEALENQGISHQGTYVSPEARSEAAYFTLEKETVAVIAYTYAANYSSHKCEITDEQEKCINFLHPYKSPVYIEDLNKKKKTVLKRLLSRTLKYEQRIYIKRKLGLQYNAPRVDDYLDEKSANPYFNQLKADIELAKKRADIVIFYPHVGGQFNIDPGKFTSYTFEKALEFGADAIVATHPHVVQKAELKGNVPCFYSIGNFCMSPNSIYLLHDNLPDYGLAVHLYIENKKIVKTTFSVLKIVETKKQPLTVYPADKYIERLDDCEEFERVKNDVAKIYTSVTGMQATDARLFVSKTVGKNGFQKLNGEFVLPEKEDC